MTMEQVTRDLGSGLQLHAFALDPSISQNDLTTFVSTAATESPNLESLTEKAALDSLDRLEVRVSDEPYLMPEQLGPYRLALESWQSNSIVRRCNEETIDSVILLGE